MNKVYVIIFDFNDHMEYESYSVENSFQGIYDSLEKSKKAIEDLVKKDEGFVRDQSKENHFIWEDDYTYTFTNDYNETYTFEIIEIEINSMRYH